MTKQAAAKVSALCTEGSYEDAVRVGLQGLRSLPQSVVLHRKMAFVFAAHERYEEAFEHIAQAEKYSDGANAKVFAQRAAMEVVSGHGPGTAAAATAISLNPRQSQYLYSLADHPQRGDYIVFDPGMLVYSPIPKVASTSTKRLLTDVEDQRAGTSGRGPHKRFNGKRARADRLRLGDLDRSRYFCFAIVRDDLDRFVSYHARNVVQAQSLVRQAGGRPELFGLPTLPTIDDLARNLRRYQFVFNDVLHHTLPTRAYLHPDPGFYDLIVSMAELPTLAEALSDHLGTPVTLPHELRSAQDAHSAMSVDGLNALRAMFDA